MMAILKARNIHSYFFTPRELKQEGFYTDGEVEEIKAYIDSHSPDTVAPVTKFNTRASITKYSKTSVI